MAIAPVAIEGSGPNHITYSFSADGNAAATLQRDVLADLVAEGFGVGSPLHDELNVAMANQAAARTVFHNNCVATLTPRTRPAGTATEGVLIGVNVDHNQVGAAAGDYRLELDDVKNADATVADYVLVVQHLHTVIR